MLYFWLTNAVHQANRASMESIEQLESKSRSHRKKKDKPRKKKRSQSEPDLSSCTGQRSRTDSQSTNFTIDSL
jgi:hypothetical protein